MFGEAARRMDLSKVKMNDVIFIKDLLFGGGGVKRWCAHDCKIEGMCYVIIFVLHVIIVIMLCLFCLIVCYVLYLMIMICILSEVLM